MVARSIGNPLFMEEEKVPRDNPPTGRWIATMTGQPRSHFIPPEWVGEGGLTIPIQLFRGHGGGATDASAWVLASATQREHTQPQGLQQKEMEGSLNPNNWGKGVKRDGDPKLNPSGSSQTPAGSWSK